MADPIPMRKSPDPEPSARRLAGLTAWTLTEGHAGMEIQARALAEALGLDPVVKRAAAPKATGWLPPRLWPSALANANKRGADLTPPWPDVLITCGRRVVAPALAIRRASREGGAPGTFAIHIQNPRVPLRLFDVVVAPDHDAITGRNVVSCLGSIHPLTARRLTAEGLASRKRFADLPRPLVTVLVGGANRAYGIGTKEMERLADSIFSLMVRQNCGVAVVPSRRTGRRNVRLLKDRLSDIGAYVWDGEDENPYLALIGLADALIVTCDSVNMVCEAAASGKPVYIMMYKGRSVRFDAFHAAMRTRGHVRAFSGQIDFFWRPAPLLEIDAVATEIVQRYRAARG
jgi:mitochondrial fission protein ELM1